MIQKPKQKEEGEKRKKKWELAVIAVLFYTVMARG
jgi:hypothetical protein